MRFLKKLAASVALIAQLVSAGNAIAQAVPATIFDPTPQPGSGWSYDPAKEGMRDLREMKPIEGCNEPGGLTRITDRDEVDSAPFWCGPAPHCLAEGTNGVDACKFVPLCRREPRGDPNGIPGGNGCRDPEDLICVSSGTHPEGGKCLKTCWDGSRILFSEACPPQCSTDINGNTVCVGDTPTPPPPAPAPLPPDPTKQSCPGGSGPYQSCFFVWGNTAHGSFVSVVSNNGVPGALSATCDNGSWINVVNTCTPTPTPTPTPSPTPTPTPTPPPTPPKPSCPAGSDVFNDCKFVWGKTSSGNTSTVSSSGPGTGNLTANCVAGAWTNVTVSCTPPEPPPTICPDGSTVPAGVSCPHVKQYCPDGVTVMPTSGLCPPVFDLACGTIDYETGNFIPTTSTVWGVVVNHGFCTKKPGHDYYQECQSGVLGYNSTPPCNYMPPQWASQHKINGAYATSEMVWSCVEPTQSQKDQMNFYHAAMNEKTYEDNCDGPYDGAP